MARGRTQRPPKPTPGTDTVLAQEEAANIMAAKEGDGGDDGEKKKQQFSYPVQELDLSKIAGLPGTWALPKMTEAWTNGMHERVVPSDSLRWEPLKPSLHAELPYDSPHRSLLQVICHDTVLPIACGSRQYEPDVEMVKLLVHTRGEWRVLWVPQTDVSSHVNIIKLAAYGVNVTAATAMRLVRFISDFKAANVGRIKTGEVIFQAGYVDQGPVLDADGRKTRDLKQGWLYGSTWISGYMTDFDGKTVLDKDGKPVPIPAPEIDHRANGFRSAMVLKGSFDEWRDFTAGVMAKHPFVRLLTGFTFASPLIRFLGERTFIVHHQCEGGGGKSASLYLGQSAFGRWSGLSHSFNVPSEVPLGAQFRYNGSYCYAIDELQACKNPEIISTFAYMVALNKPRQRGTKDGWLMPDETKWDLIVRTTGEQSLIAYARTDLGGQNSRCVEFLHPGMPKPDAKAIHNWLKPEDCCGHAGMHFLQQLWGIVHNGEVLTRLRARWRRYSETAQNAIQFTNAVNADQVAAGMVGEWFMLQWIYGYTAPAAEEEVLRDLDAFKNYWSHTKGSGEDPFSRLAGQMLDHVQAHPQNYPDLMSAHGRHAATTGADHAPIIGYRVKETNGQEAIWYNRNAFERLVKDPRWFGTNNIKPVLRKLVAHDVLVRTNSPRHFAVKRSMKPIVDGQTVYVVLLDRLRKMAELETGEPRGDEVLDLPIDPVAQQTANQMARFNAYEPSPEDMANASRELGPGATKEELLERARLLGWYQVNQARV